MPPKKSRAKAQGPITFDVVHDLAQHLPGIERSTSYGTPSLKAKGKFLTRLKEDGESIALRMDFISRDYLIRSAPETFYITDHYRDYPAVLVRLAKIDRKQLAEILEDGWRLVAPKRVVAAYDAESGKTKKRLADHTD